MSDFFDASGNRISDGVTARATDVNTLRDEVGAGFDLLPDVTNLNAGTVNYAVDTGTANAYLVALPQPPASYTDGLLVAMRPINSNSGASTINVNGLGVKSIRGQDGAALIAGDLVVGIPVDLRYSTATGFFHIAPHAAAAASASAAAASAVAAAASQSAASGSASSASTSASTATTQAGNAATSASNASTSASTASTHATNASTSASTASTHATNASTSAGAASTSASNAAASAASAAAVYDSFDDRYLGAKSSAPTLDNDGNALLPGALYWSTASSALYAYDGAAWQAAGVPIGWTGAVTKNAVINGGMMVAQHGDLTLGSSAPAANAGYGKVDMFQAWATGTAVSAGTATQDTASGIGRTGYALKLSGVTLTGTGIAYIRHRIESANSLRVKNQAASLSCRVKHDVGASINYTLTVRKANTADNFSATTTIQAGSATSVATGAETLLKLENISMGDCSNGIEIEVKAECGAVTTKNFWLAEVQFEEGAAATTFEHVGFDQALERCKRYFEKSFDYATAPADGVSYSNGRGLMHASLQSGPNSAQYYIPFEVEKRVAPTVTAYKTSIGGSNGEWRYYEASATLLGTAAPGFTILTKQITGYFTVAGGTPGYSGQLYGHWTAAANL